MLLVGLARGVTLLGTLRYCQHSTTPAAQDVPYEVIT